MQSLRSAAAVTSILVFSSTAWSQAQWQRLDTRWGGRTVLGNGVSGDVTLVTGDGQWSWDGTRWRGTAAVGGRVGSDRAAWAYDAARGEFVSFGGGTYNTMSSWIEFDDMFSVRDGVWTELSPVTRPSARSFATMAYDPVRQRCVMFGAQSGTAKARQTWEWDGVSWLLRTPSPKPSARSSASMVFVPTNQTILLFGGTWTSGVMHN